MELNIPGLGDLEPAAVVSVVQRQDGTVEVFSDGDIPAAIGLLELGKTILAASYLDENYAEVEDEDE